MDFFGKLPRTLRTSDVQKGESEAIACSVRAESTQERHNNVFHVLGSGPRYRGDRLIRVGGPHAIFAIRIEVDQFEDLFHE